jgi:hypothetical protein
MGDVMFEVLEKEAKIVIGSLDLKLPKGRMPPDEIRLWEGNPRTKHLVARLSSYPTDEDLLTVIKKVQPTAYRNLEKDIEKFGQQDPVFIRAAKSDPIETATVLEGNTRVAILKGLHEREPHNPKYSYVEAYLLPPNFSDHDLAVIMANFHVKGTLRNQWDRYQIGAFIYAEVEEHRRFKQAELAESIGKSASWVSRHLSVYRHALEYKDFIETEVGVDRGEAEEETSRLFSILEEAWKVKKFRDRMDIDPEAKETLFRWVHEGKFKDHRAVRSIEDIYSNEERREAVENGQPGTADTIVNNMGKSIPLHDDLDKLLKRIDGIQFGDFVNIDCARVTKVREALANLESTLRTMAAR